MRKMIDGNGPEPAMPPPSELPNKSVTEVHVLVHELTRRMSIAADICSKRQAKQNQTSQAALTPVIKSGHFVATATYDTQALP